MTHRRGSTMPLDSPGGQSRRHADRPCDFGLLQSMVSQCVAEFIIRSCQADVPYVFSLRRIFWQQSWRPFKRGVAQT